MPTVTLDPQAGSGMLMTALGEMPREMVEAYIRDEAERLRKQEPQEVVFA